MLLKISNILKWAIIPLLVLAVIPARAQRQYFFQKIGLEEGLPVRRINDMAQSTRGDYWLASEGAGLIHYNGYRFESFLKDRFPLINEVTCVHDSLVMFYTGDSLMGYTGREVAFLPLPEAETFSNFTNEGGVRTQSGKYYFRDKNQWVETQEPVQEAVYEVQDSLVILPKLGKISTNHGLPPLDYHKAFRDKMGQWWFLGNRGISKLGNTTEFYLPARAPLQNGILFQNWYFQSTRDGLWIQNIKNDREQRIPLSLVLDFEVFQNQLYLATERGLWRWQGKALRKIPFPDEGLPFIFSLKAQGKYLWLGTGRGIFRWGGNHMEAVSAKEGLPEVTVFHIDVAAEDSSLWCGTYTAGFLRLHEGKWQVFENMGGLNFAELQLNTFAARNARTLWLGTINDGLYRVSTQKEPLQVPFGDIQFAEVQALAIEKQQLWIASNKGYTAVHLSEMEQTQSQQVFFESKENCRQQGIRRINEEQVQIAGKSGVHVKNTMPSNTALQPCLEEVALMTSEANPPGLPRAQDFLGTIPPGTGMHRLAHHQNYLQFSYGVRFASAPHRVVYRYRLRGQQERWTFAGRRREALFPNLKPGKYSFEVQATPAGQPWPERSAHFELFIAQPFWQTWWFITLLAVVTGGGIFAFLRDRYVRTSRRLRLEKDLLESERKALRLQMNPHFIFNALDSISSFIFKNDSRQAVRYLNNFAKLMRLTLESSVESFHPVETEVNILRNYLELEKLRFKGKFEYEISLSDDIDYNVGLPSMMIQPHVENAIIHGFKPQEGAGHIAINFYLEGEYLVCEIKDNGIGREAAGKLQSKSQHRSMATKINEDRLQLLSQTKHKKVELRIEDMYSQQGEPSGTHVMLKIPYEEL